MPWALSFSNQRGTNVNQALFQLWAHPTKGLASVTDETELNLRLRAAQTEDDRECIAEHLYKVVIQPKLAHARTIATHENLGRRSPSSQGRRVWDHWRTILTDELIPNASWQELVELYNTTGYDGTGRHDVVDAIAEKVLTTPPEELGQNPSLLAWLFKETDIRWHNSCGGPHKVEVKLKEALDYCQHLADDVDACSLEELQRRFKVVRSDTVRTKLAHALVIKINEELTDRLPNARTRKDFDAIEQMMRTFYNPSTYDRFYEARDRTLVYRALDRYAKRKGWRTRYGICDTHGKLLELYKLAHGDATRQAVVTFHEQFINAEDPRRPSKMLLEWLQDPPYHLTDVLARYATRVANNQAT